MNAAFVDELEKIAGLRDLLLRRAGRQTLYHGTPTMNAPSILREGLDISRAGAGATSAGTSVGKVLRSAEGKVYLSTSPHAAQEAGAYAAERLGLPKLGPAEEMLIRLRALRSKAGLPAERQKMLAGKAVKTLQVDLPKKVPLKVDPDMLQTGLTTSSSVPSSYIRGGRGYWPQLLKDVIAR